MEIEIDQLPQKLNLQKKQLVDLIKNVSSQINLKADSIACIFVEDKFLAEMHQQYLADPEKTDVITFNLGDAAVEGEIYISFERAFEQAAVFNVSFEEEITRLVIHGLLHLAGYDDLVEPDRIKMKAQENKLLDKYFQRI
jgi:probable rRNA maturation factor